VDRNVLAQHPLSELDVDEDNQTRYRAGNGKKEAASITRARAREYRGIFKGKFSPPTTSHGDNDYAMAIPIEAAGYFKADRRR